VGNLALALVHVEDVEAEEGAGRGKAAAGAGGLVTEDAHGTAALKDVAADVLLVELVESLSSVDKSIDLSLAVVPGAEEVTTVHFNIIHERLELLQNLFQLVCHL